MVPFPDPPDDRLEPTDELRPLSDDVVMLMEQWHEQYRLGREPNLMQLCPDDSALRAELQGRIERRKHVLALLDSTSGIGAIQAAQPGRLGPYRLLEVIGRGGMGTVYRGIHERLGSEVAVKVIRDDDRGIPQARARFEREITALGALDHPRIVRAYHADEVDGVLYLSMELVKGTDLGRLVQKHGPLPVAVACELACQAAEALEEIHRHGLIHRDLKPSNLMLTPQGTITLLDLGLALPRKEDRSSSLDEELTLSGQMLGTLAYMAPELLTDSHRADPRTDLFALGGMLFKLLTGLTPDPMNRSEPAHRHNPEIPPGLETILDRLTAEKPEDRPQSAAEVAADLAPFAVGHSLPALLMRLSGSDPSEEPLRRPAPRGRRRPHGRLLLVVASLLAGAFGQAVFHHLASRSRGGDTLRAMPPQLVKPSVIYQWNEPARVLLSNPRVRHFIGDGVMTHEMPGSVADCFLSLVQEKRTFPDGIIEATCRVASGGSRGAWLLNLKQEDHHHGVLISVFGDGRVRIGPSEFDKNPDAGPSPTVVSHEAIGRAGVWNTVRLVVQGNTIGVFINGRRVGPPVKTGFLFTPAVVSFGVGHLEGPGRVQVQTKRLVFWPTTEMADLPPWPTEQPDLPEPQSVAPTFVEEWNGKSTSESGSHRFIVADGTYAIETSSPTRGYWSWPVCDYSDGIIELTARVAEGSGSAWVLNFGRLIGAQGGKSQGARFVVYPNGTMGVSLGMFEKNSPGELVDVKSITHSAIRPAGQWNTLRVVVKGNRLDVFINGYPVFGPVELSDHVSPGRLCLGLTGAGPGGRGRVEFNTLAFWPTTDIDRLPPEPYITPRR